MKRQKKEDIFDVIRTDHETVSGLFEELEATTDRAGKKRGKLFETLYSELSLHAEAEEQLVYPRLEGVKDTADLGFEAEEEHGLMKHLLQKLQGLDPTEERWLPTLSVLKEVVEHHVEEEESEVFRALRKILDRDELETLAQEFQAFKTGEQPLKQAV